MRHTAEEYNININPFYFQKARRVGEKYGHSSGLRFSLSLSYDLVGVAIFCREFVVAFEQALFLSLLCLLADGLLSIDR